MVDRLVVNGCSYMEIFSDGSGHRDLADYFKLTKTNSLALSGSSNSRIFRTTLKDSFCNEPTLYVIGITFLTRFELPVRSGSHDFEGKWVSFTTNGSSIPVEFDTCWSSNKMNNYVDFWNRCTTLGVPDLIENLMYQTLAMIDSLISRGHKVIVFNTAESMFEHHINEHRYDLLRSSRSIVDGFAWKSIPWQFSQGARWPSWDNEAPAEYRHVEPGDHKYLNGYLIDYIEKNSILD